MRSRAFSAMILLCSALSHGTSRGATVPSWLLGTWIVTNVLEIPPSNVGYSVDPNAEPIVQFLHKTMTVTQTTLQLGDETCRGPRAHRRTARRSHVMDEMMSTGALRDLRLQDRTVDYWHIDCRQNLIDGLNRGSIYPWYIIRRSSGALEMPFYFDSYLYLSRVGPTS